MKINGSLVADGSLWNDHIVPDELVAGGVKSIILGLYKHWDGAKFVLNTNCQRILTQLKNGPFVIQVYYYLYPQDDPVVEANWFTNTILTSGVDIRFSWTDAENHDVVMPGDVRSEKYRIFTEQVASKFPKIGVYTNNAYIAEWASDNMNKWINKYPAWVPEYGKQPSTPTRMTWDQLKQNWLPDYDIILSSGQINPVGHQFTGDKCILPGFCDYANQDQPLDVSEFSDAFLNAIAGSGPIPIPVPTPTPIPVPITNQYFVNISLANIRGGPSTDYPITGTIALNTKVFVSDNAQGYSKIGTQQWIATQYLTLVTNPVPNSNVYIVNIKLANIRSGSSTAYPIVGTIGLNTEVTVIGLPVNGYSQIGANQYVATQYLTKK